jgi:hypothetical protein
LETNDTQATSWWCTKGEDSSKQLAAQKKTPEINFAQFAKACARELDFRCLSAATVA